MRHKALPTYREGVMVYIEFKTEQPSMVGKWKFGDIVLEGGVNNCVTKIKLVKIPRKFQRKSVKIL